MMGANRSCLYIQYILKEEKKDLLPSLFLKERQERNSEERMSEEQKCEELIPNPGENQLIATLVLYLGDVLL